MSTQLKIEEEAIQRIQQADEIIRDIFVPDDEETNQEMTLYIKKEYEEDGMAEAIQYSRTDSNIDYENPEGIENHRREIPIDSLIADEIGSPSDLGEFDGFNDFEASPDFNHNQSLVRYQEPPSPSLPAPSPESAEVHLKKLSQDKKPDELIENNLNEIDMPIHDIFGNDCMQQELCGFDVAWSSSAAENQTRDANGSTMIYLNTADARRVAQRQVQFGFAMQDQYLAELRRTPNCDYYMGCFLSLPGYHGEIMACLEHAERFDSPYFFKVFNLGEEVLSKTFVEGFPNQPILYWKLPLDRAGDDHAMKLQFHCKSTCLKKIGSDVNRLMINFVLLDNEKRCVKHVKQLIRVTANPKRDAGGFESSQINAKRARAGIPKVGKRAIKRSSSPNSDPDWKAPVPIKRERLNSLHSTEVPGSNMMMVPSTSMVESVSDESFNEMSRFIPHDHPLRERMIQDLLNMLPEDRNRVMIAEQRRYSNSLAVALGYNVSTGRKADR